jgi:hypothetical protein
MVTILPSRLSSLATLSDATTRMVSPGDAPDASVIV